MSVDERRGPANPRPQKLLHSGATRPAGTLDAAWEPNWIDFRHSLVQADKRADAGDESLEICAYCNCEVDVSPAPHKPGCPGIGKPRASSAQITETDSERRERIRAEARRDVEGLELLEAMDSDEAELDEELEGRSDGAPASSSASPVLADEEVAAVGQSAESGAAGLLAGEPERAATTSPNSSEMLTGRRNTPWTREEIISRIRAWNAEHGAPPRANGWAHATGGNPAQSTVIKVFGSWASAIEAAGFPRPKRGGQRGSVRSKAEPDERLEKESNSPIRVPGTGLTYRSVDEALAAANEVQADGERVARAAVEDGDGEKAAAAAARAVELANKIRAAVGVDAPTAAADGNGAQEDPQPPPAPDAAGLLERLRAAAPDPDEIAHDNGIAMGSWARALIAAARAFADALEQELAA